ncbi:apoptosis regulatory protein Siva-like [Vanessa cardui]|uniref:apoptosis regulatory protein Siva-like n=1 Tax=Vanessa cardui TaxID=171605 RepID=UPI001F13A0F3|nr:apoptosis regulatory protein Siva-like [Vanessa cardui]
MAKRSNPYTEDFIQQRKMHVGLKQFNNNEDRLQKVYEKTLQLLFRGAKNIQNDIIQSCDTALVERKDGMKQLFIGKDGSLLHSGNMITEKNIGVQYCACNTLETDNCAYCEISLCAVCQHQCSICQQSYCSKCSLIGSEGAEICVSCYS